MTTAAPVALPVFDPGGRRTTYNVVSVSVLQTENMHDTAIITLRGADTAVPDLQPGTPVQLQFGWQTVDLDYFYGYIDHIETRYDRVVGDTAELEDVVCLGASYSLKDPYVGAWSDVRASSLVSKLATKYLLSSALETDDTIWPQVSSPGDSAWSFLVQLATKTGFVLACNKTMLRFLSVDLSVQRYWQTMPVFQSRNVAPTWAQQSISQFCAVQGETLSLNGNTKRVRNVAGIDLRTGRIVTATNKGTSAQPLGRTSVHPFFAEQVSSTVVSSQGHAQDVLAGMYQDNRFNYQATAILSGLTSVRQGVPIVVSGIDANNDGTWWVQEAVHKIKQASYSIHVSIGRDALGPNGLLPTLGTGVAYSPSSPFSYVIANAPPTVLVNNRWRAAHASNVAVN